MYHLGLLLIILDQFRQVNNPFDLSETIKMHGFRSQGAG